ncbi:MAG TPA: hypothetical protein VFX35_01540 [Solirubrobacterales bacterium]|nr:hypothetical protein [Solirubrobacterales bacterium]
MADRTIWLVERGDYEQTYIAAAFTSEGVANRYAKDRGGDVIEIELHDELKPQVPYWHFGAEVYPDGKVNRWDQEHLADDVDFCGPVDRAERLHAEGWGGHTQGHCGFHISVHGADKQLTEQAREDWVRDYLDRVDGRCPGCGRTKRFVTNWMNPPSQEVPVRLVGGPFDGDIVPTAFPESSFDPTELHVPIDGLIRLHGSLPDGLTDTYYGPIKQESDEYVRHHVRSRPVECAKT